MTKVSGQAGVIAPVRGRWVGFLLARTGLALLAVVCVALLLVIAFDAVFILSQSARSAAPWVLAAVGLAVTAGGLWAMLRLSPIRLARTMERSTPKMGTAITNAVQLTDQSDSGPITNYLRDQAVQRGHQHAQQAAVWPVLKRGIVAVAVFTAATGVLWLVGILVFGDVLQAVFPRLLDPAGDHPPYSRLTLSIEPQKAQVIYGGQIDIRATATGAPVQKLFLESKGTQGVSRTVMFRRPDGSYLQTLTNLREPTQYWVTDGRARSHRYPIDVVFTPRIELIEFTTKYPQYTGLAPKQRKLDSPELRLPKRTIIQWRIASNRPLASGQIRLTPLLGGEPTVVELTPTTENEKIVTGSFELTESLAYKIEITDQDGLACSEPYRGRATIQPDRSPRIYVLEPGRQAVATPQTVIPVHVRAEDDYDVINMVWFRGFNESIERPFQMKLLPDDNPGKAQTRGAFDLADLGVHPGDRVEYFFEAADNDPDGPNIATSRMYTLDIITPEQYEQVLRRMMAQRGLFEQYTTLSDHLRRIAEQAQTASEQLAASEITPKQAADSLSQAMDQYNAALDKALALPEMFDVEEAFREHLENLQKQMQELRKRAKSAGKSGSPQAQQQFDQVARDLAEMAGLLNDQVGEPARQIVQVVRLLSLSQEFVTLTQRQGELAKLARRFEDHTGELSRSQQMALQELSSAQQRIQDRINDWLQEVSQRVDELPKSPEFDGLKQQSLAFCQAVRDIQIPEELADASESFIGMDGPNAYSHALAAHEKMDSLIARNQSIPGEGQQCLKFQPALSQSLGNSLDQIMAAMSQGNASGSSKNGYGLFGEGVSFYGPDVSLPGATGAGPQLAGATGHTASASSTVSRADDPDLPRDNRPARVKLQEDTPFPLQYRELVGEYFRAVAEDDQEQEP